MSGEIYVECFTTIIHKIDQEHMQMMSHDNMLSVLHYLHFNSSVRVVHCSSDIRMCAI